MEYDRCREKMQEIDQEEDCITDHEAFSSVCLDRWVLKVAGVGLKAKAKKSYSSALGRGNPVNSK